MSSPIDGLQFPIDPVSQKPSTTKIGREMVSEALSLVDNKTSQHILREKDWRKNYPTYFKALVEQGIKTHNNAISIARQGLHKAYHSFEFYRDSQHYLLKDVALIPDIKTLNTVILQGESQEKPEWYVPYHGKKLQGQALLDQITDWQQRGIIEPSHAQALRLAQANPEWFDLSDRTMVLFGAASEAGPLTWLARWKANIIAIDLAHEKVWDKILNTIQKGNAKLIAPSLEAVVENTPSFELKHKLGVNLLTQLPEIAQWLIQFEQRLDLAAIAYLDGEKHVRVVMAMDAIMNLVSEHKKDTSLMFMSTPTDVFAVPKEVVQATQEKARHRSKLHKVLSKGIATISLKHLFKNNNVKLIQSDNGKSYGISDCLVLEQGPNYALAKRIQQWRAVLARHLGQQVSINVAPSTTTQSVIKNPLLKAAFSGAKLFDVEAFSPDTTNAIMAAIWVHDLRNPCAVAHPDVAIDHPLELIMEGANHGGLWRVPYLVRTALPFAALYGFVAEKIPSSRK